MIIAFVFMVGCAGITRIPDPDSSEARLYTEKCTGCHSLPHPKRHRFHGWAHFVKLMEEEMEKKGTPLSDEDKKVILGYLQKHAR
tara:strand:+ start:5110 stop:5364 length:255 start_codon:yes stop_codon:yes gene_type:complete